MKSQITGLCLVISIKTYSQAVQNSGDFEEIRDVTVTDPDDSAGRLFHAGPRLDGQIDGRQSAPVEARFFQEIGRPVVRQEKGWGCRPAVPLTLSVMQ